MDPIHDVGFYRDNPEEFSKLSLIHKEEMVRSITGPKPFILRRGDISTWRFTRVAASTIINIISPYLISGDWDMAARHMCFLKLEDYRFSSFVNPKSFVEFIKVFSHGCFKESVYTNNTFHDRGAANSWCHGVFSNELIKLIILNFDLAGTISIMQSFIRGNEFTAEEINSLVRYLYYREIKISKGADLKDYEHKVHFIMSELSQKRFNPTEDYYDEIVYLCIVPYHYMAYSDIEYASLKIKRPLWSRQRHKYLSDKKFNLEVRTVLLMQKYRSNDFPYRKDLINLLLTHLFDFHVEQLESEAVLKNSLVSVEMHKPYEINTDRCLKQDITLDENESIRCYMADVIDLENGLSIPMTRRERYDADLASAMVSWTTVTPVYRKICSGLTKTIYPENNLVERIILDYCKLNNISRYDLYHEIRALTDADVEPISKLIFDAHNNSKSSSAFPSLLMQFTGTY